MSDLNIYKIRKSIKREFLEKPPIQNRHGPMYGLDKLSRFDTEFC